MKIRALRVSNYRSIENLDLTFPSNFSAICGANDSGKTNIIRAIRALLREDEPSLFTQEEKISFKEDFPKWLPSDQQVKGIKVGVKISVSSGDDIGLHQFLIRQLNLVSPPAVLDFEIDIFYDHEKTEPQVKVRVGDKDYQGLEAQEVLKKIQTSKGVLFHNSTEVGRQILYREGFGQLREVSQEHSNILESMKKTVNKGMKKIAKGQQQEFEELLGRLQKKYRVSLSLPTFDFSYVPFNINLGDKKYDVSLDNWGSGTRNRTLILLTLFRAKLMRGLAESASKVTPLIIVEEPESFLHASAQAEFGRVMQDLAEEFDVQVIVTTHSPYMLNVSNPSSNILLSRKEHYNQPRDTQKIDIGGGNWMEPFGQALGLNSEELKPWHGLLLNQSHAILLVEGRIDKEYFELLRDKAHGQNKLDFEGDIVAYEGTGSLSNTVLLRFVKNRHKKLFVTYDLDAEGAVAKTLTSLQLEKGKHFIAVGANKPGKRNIEGLLPDRVRTTVYQKYPDLVAALNGTGEEKREASNKLKQLLLDEFKKQAAPGAEYYGEFYKIVQVANKALN